MTHHEQTAEEVIARLIRDHAQQDIPTIQPVANDVDKKRQNAVDTALSVARSLAYEGIR